MVPVSTSFFNQLQAKCCAVCGEVIAEQAESYMTECFTCQDKSQQEKLHVSSR